MKSEKLGKQNLANEEQKNVSFGRLVFEALPEMWSFHFVTAIILAIVTKLILWLMTFVANTQGAATTANIKDVLLSWRASVLLLLGLVLILCYIVAELLAQIYLTDDILKGHPSGIRHELWMGIQSLKRFVNPTGLFVMLFIFIAVPVTGIGFSISLTESFHIPNFILDVVLSKPLYAVGYLAVLLLLIWVAYRYCFTVHAVLLDGMSASEGRRHSAIIIKKHGRGLIVALLKTYFILALIQIAAYMLFCYLPEIFTERIGSGLPHDRVIDFVRILGTQSASETEYMIIVYRIHSAFVILVGGLFFSSVTLLCGAYFMLCFTGYYMEYSSSKPSAYLERPKKSRYRRKLISMFGIIILMALLSFVLGLGFNEIFDRDEPVKIVAHRAGGTLASENSLEGLNEAIKHKCYASETDIQRTKDGYYVINHDNDFKRLTGVSKAPKDMTMEEIRGLRITDTTGNGEEHSVVTIEEMLDVIKGKEKLFIELKGATADRRMVDDIVRIVREKDCVDDTVLISLSYDVIDYAETNYPEFETGTLFFAGIGDVSNLNCDLLIMEEEMGTDTRIRQIHDSGKMAIVWTVNTEESMRRFLDSDVDAIITDEIELAERMQKELDERTEYEVLEAKLEDFWE